jgi:hypothetical protein
MKGNQEVVKKSGRDESIWVVIHMYMETMLRIFLCSYLFLKLAKMLSFLLLLMSSLQQNWKRGQNRFCLELREGRGRGWGEGGEIWTKQCIHI